MAERPWHREYTIDERAAFNPPPCPNCGSRNGVATWEESTDTESIERIWMPTRLRCLNCYGRP